MGGRGVMEWKEKPAFGGFLIWVAEVEGHWIASTAAVPQRGATVTAGPGDHVIPAEFATEDSAVKAAMNDIVRKRNPEARGK
jgi:hypothetical protein